MATYYTAEDYRAATFDDILVDINGDRGRIVGESARGVAWLVQSLTHDNVRRVVFKDTRDNRARRVYAIGN
jgi:hypothetical protein